MKTKNELLIEIKKLKNNVKDFENKYHLMIEHRAAILSYSRDVEKENKELKERDALIEKAYGKLSMIHSESLLLIQDLENRLTRKTWYGRLIERIRNKILRKKWHE